MAPDVPFAPRPPPEIAAQLGPPGQDGGARSIARLTDYVLRPPPFLSPLSSVARQGEGVTDVTARIAAHEPPLPLVVVQSTLPDGYSPSSLLAGPPGARIETQQSPGGAGALFDFEPSPYGTPKDIPIPGPGNPTEDAPIGKGLEHLPKGHPWRHPPFGDPPTDVPFYRALYAQFTWTARFTNDGYILTDLVDISDCIEVKREGGHIAARFSHAKLQKKLNEAKPKYADQMPMWMDKDGVFFNDLDDVGFELKPPPPGGVPPVKGPGGKSASPRDHAERFRKKKRGRVRLNVRYTWPNKNNPVPPKDRPKGKPRPPQTFD